MLFLVQKLCARGICHVRLTGGEPLLKKDLGEFIKALSSVSGIQCLSLTTNGYRLGRFASSLKANGLNRINISLDTLKPDRFKKCTGVDGLREVCRGIGEAKRAGFRQVKLNVVLMKGVNDDEILDFVRFGREAKIDVRFIEYFVPNLKCDVLGSHFVSSSFVKETIEAAYGAMDFLGPDPDAGPAQYYRLKNETSRIGFISSVTDFFCGQCNRLRLTCDGKLYPCLHSDYHVNLKKALNDNDEEGWTKLMDEVFSNKKFYNKVFCGRSFEMSAMGG